MIPAFLRNIFELVKRKIQTSLRLQLIVIFLVCVVAAVLTVMITASALNGDRTAYSYTSYEDSIDRMESTARFIEMTVRLDLIEFEIDEKTQIETIQQFIAEQEEIYPYKIMFIDQDGVVLAKTMNVFEKNIEIQPLLLNTINKLIETRNGEFNERQEYTTVRSVYIRENPYYIVVQGVPEANQVMYYQRDASPIPFILGITVFFVLFYFLTKRKMRIIEDVAEGLQEIAKGNLTYRIEQKSQDELGTLAMYINRMAKELGERIESERAAEKTKNELITNVSHDLRTPLTLIMGYLRALKDKKYDNEGQSEEYLNIAYEKSEKLQRLLEDLFEYTKLNNHGYVLQKEVVSMNELLEQLLEEYVPIFEENQLGLSRILPTERVFIEMDADQMVRVFENLLNNAVRYSIRPSLIRVSMKVFGDDVLIQFRNNSEKLPVDDLSRLFERFYRGDHSRSSKTGGSGLGLAIAKSIVTLHNGDIWAECDEDTVTITVRLQRHVA